MGRRGRACWTYDRQAAPAGGHVTHRSGRKSNGAVEDNVPSLGDVSPITPSTTIGDLRQTPNGLRVSGAADTDHGRSTLALPYPSPQQSTRTPRPLARAGYVLRHWSPYDCGGCGDNDVP